MHTIIKFISSIGIRAGDNQDTILQKRFLVYQALLMSGGGIVWGVLAISFDFTWQATIPLGYVLLSAANLIVFHLAGTFTATKTIQTGISLLLPFLFQWSFGGFLPSGAAMLWALLALAASVTYQSNRTVALWLMMYVGLTIVSGILDRTFAAWFNPAGFAEFSLVVLVFNIVVISAIVLWLVTFLVRGKHETLQQLQRAQSQLIQSEKMATLGTLAAGVAHELNNPAAATRRAAQQLQGALTKLENARASLDALELHQDDRELMRSLAGRASEHSRGHSAAHALERSDSEEEVQDWLNERHIDQAWELAPSLVSIGLGKTTLEDLSRRHDGAVFNGIIMWAAYLVPAYSLLHEISEGSARVSDIVVGLKNYSFLGQAPIQLVNVHACIDNTLLILRSRLREGITVHRAYGTDVPEIMAYGSELNQVWTNLLDNAIDAMNGKGDITISTRKENRHVVVEIEDTGPGIPESIQSKIFDPFFTTKEPGKGTGLGLSTSYGIVTEKHRGTIRVVSRPGSTRFSVALPIESAHTPSPSL